MSSFSKNIIPRRAHKERSQPTPRLAKHGLLEKKQDYRLRARDRNRKKLRLKLLKEKAAFRNPDEFYHGMISQKTSNGVNLRVRNDAELDSTPLAQRDAETRLLTESRDTGYVGMKRGVERGRLDRMQKGLHFVAAAGAAKRAHVMFVDDEDEMARVVEERENGSDTFGTDQNRRVGRVVRKERARMYKELEQRTGRHEKLQTVLQDMATSKTALSKGRRFLVRRADPRTGAPAVFRWQQERKR